MIFNKRNIKIISIVGILILISSITIICCNNGSKKQNKGEKPETSNESKIVYDGLTLEELASKLDNTLSSDLKGYGYVYAKKSVELGLDPYLAVAITMLETGCKWNCSSLLKKCNNVAGIKGKPGCNGGSYKKFTSLEEGINYFLEMLYNKYYSKGLTTPELINPKYAEDKTWASKVNKYIEDIKAS